MRTGRPALAGCLLLGVLVAPLCAQPVPTTLPAGRPETEPSLGFETPQATMRGYLTAGRAGDWARAALHLDLRGQRPEAGPRLARQLKSVLDRTLWVDLESLDDTVEGRRDDGLPARRDLVGIVQLGDAAVKIVVERVRGPDGSEEWKISRDTVQHIPRLYAALGDSPLAELMPRPLVEITVLEVRLWQWLGLLVLVAAAVGLAWAVTAVVKRIVSPIVRRTSSRLDDALAEFLVGPLRLVMATAVLGPGIRVLRLAIPAERVLVGVQSALLILAGTWVALRLIDALARVAEQRLLTQGSGAAAVIPLGRRTAKGFAVAIAVLLVLGNFGFNVTGVLAGLGVGGIAVALGAQRSLEHLFGGVSIIADAPVRVGDFCRFGDRMGTVVDIGLRSTRIRTLERTVVTVPNAEFSTMQLENFALRDSMLLTARFGVRYETTPAQLRWLLERLERLLAEHPRILPEPRRVRFVGFGTSSLDLEIFAYAATTDLDEFTRIRQEIFLDIMGAVAEAGTAFAFPSHTVYTTADPGLDPARRRHVAAATAATAAPSPPSATAG